MRAKARRRGDGSRHAHAQDARQALREQAVDGDLGLARLRAERARRLALQLRDERRLHALRVPHVLCDLAAADGAPHQEQRLQGYKLYS